MSGSAALRRLAWSLGTAAVAALLGWFVDAALLGHGIPGETAAALGAVTLALGCFLGTRLAAGRPTDQPSPQWRGAALLTGPAVLALAYAASSSPAWFGWLAAGGIVVVSVCGLVTRRETGDDRENPYTTSRTAGRRTLRAARADGDQGSGALEYVGIVSLASVLVVASVAAVSGSRIPLADEVWARICQILGGNCSAGTVPSNQAYKPPDCDLSRNENEIRGIVDIAFVRLGGSGAVQRIDKSDGTTELSLLGTGRGGVVAAAGGKGELEIGSRSYGAELEAEAALTAGFVTSETWVFANRRDADAFEAYLQRELGEDVVAGADPVFRAVNGVVEWVTGEEPPANDGVRRTLVRYDLTGEAKASANLGYGTGAEVSASAMVALGTEFDAGARPDDPSDDTRADFYQVDWRAAAQAGLPVVAGFDAAHAASGIVKVTRDAGGRPIKVEILDESTGGFQYMVIGSDGGVRPVDPDFDPAKPGHQAWDVVLQGGPNHSVVVRQDLVLDDPDERAAFDQWFDIASGAGTAGLQTVPGVDSVGRAVGGGAFEQILRDRARVSIVEYDGTTWGLGAAVEAGLGIKVGADIGYEHREAEAVTAHYLGAPGAGGRREPIQFPECTPR